MNSTLHLATGRSLSFRCVTSVALFLMSWVTAGANEPPQTAELSGETMGTTYSIKYRDLGDISVGDLLDKVEAELKVVNRQASTYDSQSEISRFNRWKSTEPFEVSAGFGEMIAESIRISEMTGGKFDITVGPLVDFWGFGAGASEAPRRKLPSQSEIDTVLKRIGISKLSYNETSRTIQKTDPELQLDLSAIAKGIGVDRVAEILAQYTSDFMVEIGGEVRASGLNPQTEERWLIGIEDPSSGPIPTQRKMLAKVRLEDQSIATSGNYRNFIVIDDKAYQHTIDPTTGYPVEQGVYSVSVVHSDCGVADALATSMMVMSPAEIQSFASENRLGVLAVFRGESGTTHWMSEQFPGDLITAADNENVPKKKESNEAFSMIIGAIVIFGLAIAGMAIGVIISNRQLKGSCGGLSAMSGQGDSSPCSLCSKPATACPKKQELENEVPPAE